MNVSNAIAKSMRLLPPRDRRLLIATSILQMLISILDVIGVLLLGLMAAIGVSYLQDSPLPETATTLLDSLGVARSTGQLVAIFGAIAAVSLLAKSVISAVLNRRIFRFLGNRQAAVSSRLATALLTRPLYDVQRFTSHEIGYALTFGANAATLQLLGQVVIAMSEVALLVFFLVALIALDPLLTLGAVVLFGITVLALQKTLGSWATELAEVRAETLIASTSVIRQAVLTYREILVLNRRSFYTNRIGALRWRSARAEADSQFLAIVPKLVLESALVVGTAVLAVGLFLTRDTVAAISTMVLFLAAGSRVMPSLLRLQGAALGIRSAAGGARPTYELAEFLDHPSDTPLCVHDVAALCATIRAGHTLMEPAVRINRVTFSYPGAAAPAINNVNLEISAGSSVGIVGTSGAGKSTLADLILGVFEPDTGEVVIGGISAAEAVREWPGGISYVPQEVALVSGNVRDNVALGLPRDAIDDDLVWEALSKANIADFFAENRGGLDTEIGEDGHRLSGGQRQRLGIARALYSRPRLIVLDEATSALDAEIEHAIAETIRMLGTGVTSIVIAHRLATIRNLDSVVYLEGGRVAAKGAFEEVREQSARFDRQARLLGL